MFLSLPSSINIVLMSPSQQAIPAATHPCSVRNPLLYCLSYPLRPNTLSFCDAIPTLRSAMNGSSAIRITKDRHRVTNRCAVRSWQVRTADAIPVRMKGAIMKIVVIGGSGLIGSKLVNKLREQGHEAIPASPNTGVNTITGEGLAKVLQGASVVVDVSNSPSFEETAAMNFFT